MSFFLFFVEMGGARATVWNSLSSMRDRPNRIYNYATCEPLTKLTRESAYIRQFTEFMQRNVIKKLNIIYTKVYLYDSL